MMVFGDGDDIGVCECVCDEKKFQSCLERWEDLLKYIHPS